MSNEKSGVKNGCLWAVIVSQSLVIGMIMLFVLFGVMINGCLSVVGDGYVESGTDEFPQFTEKLSSGSGDTKVVRIPLRGLIMLNTERGIFDRGEGSADTVLASIKRATNDPEVKAIIMDIDSGGGGVTSSDIIYNALLKFKEAQKGRVIVSCGGDVVASGAYYIALASDRIVVRPTTVTGSIGVLMQSYNIAELAAKIGVADVTIKSGKNKDLLNPFNVISPEQQKLLQNIVDGMYNRFVSLVVENRDLADADVRKVADGRVLLPEEAKSTGLIDQIGYWDDAVDLTEDLLGKDQIRIIRYSNDVGLSALFGGRSSADALLEVLNKDTSPKMFYLWK